MWRPSFLRKVVEIPAPNPVDLSPPPLPEKLIEDGRAFQVSPTVRVEVGPERKVGVATKELLSNKATRSHYQVGKPDALGKIISLGDPMTYVDWNGDWVWHVYQTKRGKYVEIGCFSDKEAALAKARSLS